MKTIYVQKERVRKKGKEREKKERMIQLKRDSKREREREEKMLEWDTLRKRKREG